MTSPAGFLPVSPDRNTRAKGASAESFAIEYLEKNGYSIVCRNYRRKIGEIDCIAKDRDGTTVFVEVKSARTDTCGHPFSWVTPAKQHQIARVARRYLMEQGSLYCRCRFDVIAVVNNKIEHLKNAFLV